MKKGFVANLSDLYVNLILERGAMMSIFEGTTVAGWWKGVKGPIGRIGKPINNRQYYRFDVKGIVLFIENKLIEVLPPTGGMINVLMGDYGSWTISFA